MGTKGIDQRPYDRERFNKNFDEIFNKEGKANGKDKSEGQSVKASKRRGDNQSNGSDS